MPVSIRSFFNLVRVTFSRKVRASALRIGRRSGYDVGRQDHVALDADRLIARFRDQAYGEARARATGRCVDGADSPRHWAKVKLEIARRQDIAIGLTGADLRA